MAHRRSALVFWGPRRSGPPRAARSLWAECLEPRVVLSGVTDPVSLAPPEAGSDPSEIVAPAVTGSVCPIPAVSVGTGDVEVPVATGDPVLATYLPLASSWATWATCVNVPDATELADSAAVAGGGVGIVEEIAVDVDLAASIGQEQETALLGAGTDLEIPPLPDPEPDPPGSIVLPPLTAPPVITEFTGTCDGNFWEFTGRVTDDKSVSGLVVRFGGILQGRTATVNQFGCFSLAVFLSAGTHGGITAITTDQDGLDSNLACFFVDC